MILTVTDTMILTVTDTMTLTITDAMTLTVTDTMTLTVTTTETVLLTVTTQKQQNQHFNDNDNESISDLLVTRIMSLAMTGTMLMINITHGIHIGEVVFRSNLPYQLSFLAIRKLFNCYASPLENLELFIPLPFFACSENFVW